MKAKWPVLATVILWMVFLAGCGSDGGGSTQPVISMLSGKVSDAPVSGAAVFIDENNNGEYDGGELKTVTEYDGLFTLILDDRELQWPLGIIASGGQNTITKKTFNEKFRAKLRSLEDRHGIFITPLSDLVALHNDLFHGQAAAAFETGSVSAPTLSESEEIIAKALKLDGDKILTDPMGDYQVFQAAQEVQATKGLLVGADSSLDVEEIKKVLVRTLDSTGTLDPKTVIANVETALNISFSDGINAFLVNELDYIDELLASLDTASNLKYMRYIQGDIETKAHARLATRDLNIIVKAQKVYVALSGGGWHAHTTHVAWVMGALDGMESDGGSRSLETLTEHVEAISSNSGGSWFLSMLGFADAFKTQVETYTTDEYCTTGWLGKQEDIFNSYYDNGHGMSDTSKLVSVWAGTTKRSVFDPFDLYDTMSSTTLDDPHLPWAMDKSLLFATALGTGRHLDGLGITTYPGITLNGKSNASNPDTSYLYEVSDGSVYPQVCATPVLLTSLGDSGRKKPVPFLTGDFTLKYAEGNCNNPSSWTVNKYNADVSTCNVSPYVAATCSSACFGIAADASWSMASWFSGAGAASAVPMQIAGNGIEFVADGIQDGTFTYEDAAKANYMRFFDGGYIDNTSAAYMMRYLQENGLDNNFKIVVFMNDTGSRSEEIKNQGHDVDVAVAKLFGKCQLNEEHQTTRVMSNFWAWTLGLNPRVMSPQIFDDASWESIQGLFGSSRDVSTGDGSNKTKITLQYRVYNVTTQENTTLGIKAGSKGELHVFTNYQPDGTPAPGQTAGPTITESFDRYHAMLKTVRESFGNVEWQHLKSAFNLIK